MGRGTKITSDEMNEHEASSSTPLLKRDRGEVRRRDTGSEDTSTEHIEDDWDVEENRDNPRNWASWFKWSTVILVSFIEFLT